MDVLTATLNPALDREIVVENFTINDFHRVKNPSYSKMDPGGKGINVSVILSGIGVRNVAMGFLGGYIGKVVEEKLRTMSDLITTNFLYVEEETRENIAIVDPIMDTITEINSSGP
ncbi:MAG TPA: PfkB family carbohydrate kinase, partial [Mesotoga sp.]|nr:PfkB family carbohydrate kinase [Mesotoga sp.]